MKRFFLGLLCLTSSIYVQAGQKLGKQKKSPSKEGYSQQSYRSSGKKIGINPIRFGSDDLGNGESSKEAILRELGLDSGKEKRKDHMLFRQAYLFWRTIFSTPTLSKKLSFFKAEKFPPLAMPEEEKRLSAYAYQKSKNNKLLEFVTSKDQSPENIIEASWNMIDLLYNKKEKAFLEEATFCDFVFDFAKAIKDQQALDKMIAISRNSEKSFDNLKLLERSFAPMTKEFLKSFLKSSSIQQLQEAVEKEEPLEKTASDILLFFRREANQELFRMVSTMLDQKLEYCLTEENLGSDTDFSDALALYAYHEVQKCCKMGDSEKAAAHYEIVCRKTQEFFDKLKKPHPDLGLFLGDLFSYGNPMRSRWTDDYKHYQFYSYPVKQFLLNTEDNFYHTVKFYQHASEHSESKAALFEILSRKLSYFPENSAEEELEGFQEALSILSREHGYADASRILFEMYFELPQNYDEFSKDALDGAFDFAAYEALVAELKKRQGVPELYLDEPLVKELAGKKNYELAIDYLRLGCQQNDFISQFIWAYLSRYGLIVPTEEDRNWIDVFMDLGHQEYSLALDWVKQNEQIPDALVSYDQLKDYTHQVIKQSLLNVLGKSEDKKYRAYVPLTEYQKKLANIYLETLNVFEKNMVKDEAQSLQKPVQEKPVIQSSSDNDHNEERRETSFL